MVRFTLLPLVALLATTAIAFDLDDEAMGVVVARAAKKAHQATSTDAGSSSATSTASNSKTTKHSSSSSDKKGSSKADKSSSNTATNLVTDNWKPHPQATTAPDINGGNPLRDPAFLGLSVAFTLFTLGVVAM